MLKLKRIKVLSFAKFQAILMALLGLLCGVLYSIGGLFIDTLVTLQFLSPETWSTPGLSYGTVLALGALSGMPIIFGLAGFFGGIVEAVLHNLVVPWFGGFNIEFEGKD